MVDGIPKYDQMCYTTSEGEHCCAQKSGDTVTIQGDLHGVRQVLYKDFLPQFVKDQAAKGALQGPQKDTVCFSGNTGDEIPAEFSNFSYHDIENLKQMTAYSRPTDFKGDYTMDNEGSGHPLDNFHLSINNKLLGRKVTGQIFTKDANLEVKTSALNTLKGTITGTIGGKAINVSYKESDDRKGLVFSGNLPDVEEIQAGDILPVLALLAYDKA